MSNKISAEKVWGGSHSDVEMTSSPQPKSPTKSGSKKYPNDDDRRAPSDMRKKDLVAALANEKENVKNLEAKVKQLEGAPGGDEVSHVERSELQDQREEVLTQQETLLTQQKAVLKQEQAALRKEKAEVTKTKERLKEKEKLLEWGFDEQEGVLNEAIEMGVEVASASLEQRQILRERMEREWRERHGEELWAELSSDEDEDSE